MVQAIAKKYAVEEYLSLEEVAESRSEFADDGGLSRGGS